MRPVSHALLLLAALTVPGSASAQASRVEHVVVVLLDDCGVDKIAAYGEHPTAGPTPVIDRLAANGLLFRNAYSDPVCSPTRCAALTGRYGSRTGIGVSVPTFDPRGSPNGPFAPSDLLPWLPRQLGRAGVHSFACGKWHLTHVNVPGYHQHPIRTGFTLHSGHLANLVDGQGQSPYSWPKNIASAAAWSERTTTTYVTADNMAEAFEALSRSAGQRSFVWLALTAPHAPWNPPPPAGLYTPVPGLATPVKLEQYALQAADTLLGELIRDYGHAHPDDAAATLWIVMGDNGSPVQVVEPPWPNYQHKGTVYQGGVHVPLIAWGAGVASPGRETDHLVHAVDLWATLLELFEVDPPAGATDSLSFAPVLADAAAAPARTSVYCRTHEPNGFGPYTARLHTARNARWKLNERTPGGVFPEHELFDLQADPLEEHDLWPGVTSEELAAVAELTAVLVAGDAPLP